MTEHDLVAFATPLVEDLWDCAACVEVPVFSRCADMVVERDDGLVAIEFKLHDWRRGLQQAQKHRLAVDYTYICLPRPSDNLLKTIAEWCDRGRIGLLVVDTEQGHVSEVVAGRPLTPCKWERDRIRSFLEMRRRKGGQAQGHRD